MKRSSSELSHLSLRARATSWYVGLLAVALVVFSIGTYIGLRTYLKQNAQRSLAGVAQTIANNLISRLPEKGTAWVQGELRESYEQTPNDRFIRISTGAHVFFQTADMRNPSVPVDSIQLPKLSHVGAFHRQKVDGQSIMIYSLPYQTSDGRVLEIEVGICMFSMQQTLHSLLRILLAATLVTLLAAAFGGYLLMVRPLRPLVALTEKAERIGRKELGERLPVIPTGDELERLTHALNSMIDRLENALDHNYRFSADASHELRTPLTIMRGEMEETLQLGGLPPQAVDNLASTIEEIERMSRIVNSLMTITRLDAGGERMDIQRVDLSALVRTTMDHMRLLADEKSLPLTFACEREVFVMGDPMRLKQVIVNLVDNAIKYTPAENTELEEEEPAGSGEESTRLYAAGAGAVDVSVFLDEGSAVLRVADHGVGIAADAVPFVFDRFYRADFARNRRAGGVGLGLAITKAIISAHDGTVSIASTLGLGSVVTVHLPAAVADVEAS